jgi:hypothetical protein
MQNRHVVSDTSAGLTANFPKCDMPTAVVAIFLQEHSSVQSREEVSDTSAGLPTNFPKGAIPITVRAEFRSVKCRTDEKLVTSVQGRADV